MCRLWFVSITTACTHHEKPEERVRRLAFGDGLCLGLEESQQLPRAVTFDGVPRRAGEGSGERGGGGAFEPRQRRLQ